MQKDIKHPQVKDVGVAIIKEKNDSKTDFIYNVYLINFGNKIIENVLVSSKGYGENKSTGEQIKTSILRHTLGDVKANSFAKIEPIIENVFGLNNEYLISFFIANQMYDKKYVFLAESVSSTHLIQVPLINKLGVLIN